MSRTWTAAFRLRRHLVSSVWTIPTALILAALVLAELMPALDAGLDSESNSLSAETARSSLQAIATGMIAFTGFVFSMAMVVVQLGNSVFSSRVLRLLRRDPLPKVALGTFTATSVYALSVLTEVGSTRRDYVPVLSWLVGLLLLLASVAVFLALMQRMYENLRTARVLREVGQRGREAIDAIYPTRANGAIDDETLAYDASAEAEIVRYDGPVAVVVAIERRTLVHAARRAGAMLVMVPAVGDTIAPGDGLFRVVGARRPPPARSLRRAVVLEDERTIEQDPGFALRLLVDVAVRALSPAINDPTTVVQALDQIEDLLVRLAARRLGAVRLADRTGAVRLVYSTPTFEDFLHLALDEIRVYGRGSLQVARRMRALLADLDRAAPEARRPPIERQLDQLDAAVAAGFEHEPDRAIASVPDHQGIGHAR